MSDQSSLGVGIFTGALESDGESLHIDFSNPDPIFSSVEEIWGVTENEVSAPWSKRLWVWFLDDERLTLVDSEWARFHQGGDIDENRLVKDLYSIRVPEDALVLLNVEDVDKEARYMLHASLEPGTEEFESLEEAISQGDSGLLEDGMATRIIVRAALGLSEDRGTPLIDSYEEEDVVVPDIPAAVHREDDEW